MTDTQLYAYLILLAIHKLAENVVMRKVGTLTRRPQRE
jgi:hypothetical protein